MGAEVECMTARECARNGRGEGEGEGEGSLAEKDMKDVMRKEVVGSEEKTP
jgi:hypothetical protein